MTNNTFNISPIGINFFVKNSKKSKNDKIYYST